MSRFTQALIRLSAFIYKELFEVLRQTRLIASVVLGPFLILLLFGIGFRDEPRVLNTLFVIPEDAPEMRTLIEDILATLDDRVAVAGIIDDNEMATDLLRRQQVDLVVLPPTDPLADIRNNERATFQLYHAEIDPFEATYISVLGRAYADQLNRDVLELAADEGKVEAESLQASLERTRATTDALESALAGGDGRQAQTELNTLKNDVDLLALSVGALAVYAGLEATVGGDELAPDATAPLFNAMADIQQNVDTLSIEEGQASYETELASTQAVSSDLDRLEAGLSEFLRIDSEVLVNPFRSEVIRLGEVVLGPTDFFVPAVLALLIQHIAVSFAALSIIRERTVGAMDLFRVSPVTPLETLLGKYTGYLLLIAVIAVSLTLLVVIGMNVPLLGPWLDFGLSLLGLTIYSLGIGFIISLLARTESQAIQLAMLVLLASVFFSGLFLALRRIWLPVRVFSWLLPATYGTALLQDVMLRGQGLSGRVYGGLLGLGALAFMFAWLLLRLRMSRD